MKKDILIKNAVIASLNDEIGIIDNGYILIKNGLIKSIGKGEYSGDLKNVKIIDGKDFCVMPGLINCHTHAAMTLLRGYGEGLPLMKWLNEKIWPMEAKFKEKHIKLGTELACVEMLRSGTTTFSDMYFMEKEVLNVVKESKMRAILGVTILGDKWKEQINESLELINILKNENEDKIKMMFAPHAPYTLSYEALKEVAEIAKQKNKRVHIHVSETQDEVNTIKNQYNKTTCELLNDVGMFDNKVLAAHCVYLTQSDMEIIKQKNVSPVYNVQSNMKLASGISKVAQMLDFGINVCMGTDGCSSNNNLNMFEEMETGALLQKLNCNNAVKLDAKTALNMATYNGAKALGFENLGMIKEGYKADIIMLNLNKPNMIPNYDVYSNLVFSANGSEVEYVIIDGEILMEKGQLINIDEEKVIFETKKLCKELVK